MSVDSDGLHRIAVECVALVETEFGRTLDWGLDSLTVLDEVCQELVAPGPLEGQRLDLWWKLVGAYLGEVVISAYEGEWIEHDEARGAYAVRILGLTGYPFSTAYRVLRAEPYKSVASFARAIRRPPPDLSPGNVARSVAHLSEHKTDPRYRAAGVLGRGGSGSVVLPSAVEDLDTRMDGVEWERSDAFLNEHPDAYQDIDTVMKDAADLVTIDHTLRQIIDVIGD